MTATVTDMFCGAGGSSLGHGVPWIALTDAWAADSSLGLRSWIEEHWPNEGDR